MDLLEWVCGIIKGKAYEHEGKINHIAATFREGSKWVCWPEKLMLNCKWSTFEKIKDWHGSL